MSDAGLYIHFPFCRKKCGYCDFYSVTDLLQIPFYEDALIRAIRHYSAKYPGRNISSVYFGGGTPSLMTLSGIESALSEIKKDFSVSPGAEITFEMNPESVTPEKLAVMKNCGVNRVSMGMQSSNENLLCALGRIHSAPDTKKAVSAVREAGFRDLSLDLMYGLPGQKTEDWKKTLADAVSLSPEHISFYLLTLSENVPLAGCASELPDDAAVREMYLFAVSFLKENGYGLYEISNASKPGMESRHNLGYWQRKEYIGIGAAAHSFVGNRRFYTEPSVEKFIACKTPGDFDSVICDEEVISDDDAFEEYIMLSLRTSSGIDLETVKKLGGAVFLEECILFFGKLAENGFAEKTERGFSLTPEGMFVSNSVITEILLKKEGAK